MITGEDAREILQGNLNDLEAALGEGDADRIALSERVYHAAMTEYFPVLSRKDRTELNTKYREIKNGN